MVLWLGLAVLSAVVVAVLLAPLLRSRPVALNTGDPSAVYRDQLRELETEHQQGLIGDAEHQAARAELARRLIALGGDGSNFGEIAAPSPATAWIGLALTIAGLVPTAAMAIYLAIGAPHLPAQPLSARLKSPLETAKVGDLVRAVEARLRQNPEDGQGWDVIGPVYLKQGRYRDAADAFTKATRLLGESAKRLAGFAEASVLEHDGIVTEPARLAYEKLVKLEPSRPEPRFWLALAKEQDGQLDAAAVDYESLISSAPDGAPWVGLVIERRDDLRRKLAGAAGTDSSSAQKRSAPGPSSDDVAAAAKLSPAERQKMIEGMVQSLAQRLEQNGSDLPGWERLIRAYSALSRKDDAIAALAQARRNFTNDPPALAMLSELARRLGLES